MIGPIVMPVMNAPLPWECASNNASIEALINSEISAGSWDGTCFGFLAKPEYLTLSGSDVTAWVDFVGGSISLEPGTSPAWNATGLNGRGTVDYTGASSHALVSSAAVNSGSANAYAMIALFLDSDTTAKIPFEWGNSGLSIATNVTSAGTLRSQSDGNAGVTSALSAATYPMTNAGVATATWDTNLATNETEIRHGSTNITNTRPANTNNASGAINATVGIGGRYDGSSFYFTGSVAACVVLCRTTTIDAAALTAVANIEALLSAEWGV